jgi:predicted transcriptional regulator of viral defense system
MPASTWGFLTNHALALILIHQNTRITTREIADTLDITERTVHRIISDLDEGGYIHRQKEGRRNRYEVRINRPIQHPALTVVPASELLQIFTQDENTGVAAQD